MEFSWWQAGTLGWNALGAQGAWGCLALGALLGACVGLLPGVRAATALAVVLPSTLGLPALSALALLTGLLHGVHYAGAVPAILRNQPGSAAAVMTSADGHHLFLLGQGRHALRLAALASFGAAVLSLLALMLLAPWVTQLGYWFGPAEYFSLLVLTLMGVAVMANGPFSKVLAMALLGLLLGLVGWDIDSGSARFVPNALMPLLGSAEGLNSQHGFLALVLGAFVVAPLLRQLGQPEAAPLNSAPASTPAAGAKPWAPSPAAPTPPEPEAGATPRAVSAGLRGLLPTVARAGGLGALLGLLPGGGALLASVAAYRLEQHLRRQEQPPVGNGHWAGVVAPEAANSAGAQSAFLPLLALGLPTNGLMALLLGALVLHQSEPGTQLMAVQPGLFWGLLLAMGLAHVLLLLLHLPGNPVAWLWGHCQRLLLGMPRHAVAAALLLGAGLGALSLDNSGWAFGLMLVFGLLSHGLGRLGFDPAVLLIGFVLSPSLETHLRHALQLARGNAWVLVERPLSATLLSLAGVLLLVAVLPRRRFQRP